VVIPLRIHLDRPADFFEVDGALNLVGRLANRLDGGKYQSDKHHDNGDDHEQLHEREALACFPADPLHWLILRWANTARGSPYNRIKCLEPPADMNYLQRIFLMRRMQPNYYRSGQWTVVSGQCDGTKGGPRSSRCISRMWRFILVPKLRLGTHSAKL